MIFILFRKITATALACLIATVTAAGYFENNNYSSDKTIPKAITAEAATVNVTTPTIKLYSVYGDRAYITISNIVKYKAGTKFNVYVNNVLANKNVSLTAIKNNRNLITVTNNGKVNLRPNTAYTIKVKAVYNGSTSATSNSVKTKTTKTTYFNLKKNTQLYALKNGKMVKSTKLTSSIVTSGAFATSTGEFILGKDPAKYKSAYIKITSGTYKGKFVKISDNVANRVSVEEYKRRVVCDYAAGMHGGRYVYGGLSYRATDCSGLVLLSYKQIGINLPHSANGYWSKGKAVSRSNLKAGDIIIMNGGSHVGLYIGNSKFVHAMNYYDGIKVQSTSYLQYYTVNSIRRII